MENIQYCSYGDYMVAYSQDKHSFDLYCKGEKSVKKAKVEGFYADGKKVFELSDFNSVTFSRTQQLDHNIMLIKFEKPTKKVPCVGIKFIIDYDGIRINFDNIGFYTAHIVGELFHGKDSFAINTDKTQEAIRSAIGPATSNCDNGIYNKKKDTALVIENCADLRLSYNWDKSTYEFNINTANNGHLEKILFSIKERILADKYHIDFVPMKKRSGYNVPPAGWMTWYAVKFDACEEAVLRNTKFQEKHLKEYGANTIWVDWEWYHKCFEFRRDDGVDTFNPDPVKYPHGLKYVSDKIKKAGFTPALWMGFTNDLSHNKYTKVNPDIMLAEEETWCGSYFYDFSNPKYLNEFLPMAVKQVKDWGYEAVKFDTLPVAMSHHEKYHNNMLDPTLTTMQAYKKMIKKVRKLVGDDTYMMSCACIVDSDILYGAGVFDGARVGDDVFMWKDFIAQCIDKVRRYYPLHNIVLYNDPDNVILRDEFNNDQQAISRISFVSLLGLPITFGDDLPNLQEKRVDLLKRALPVMDIHPMDLKASATDGQTQLVNLSVATAFENYNVVDVMNMAEKPAIKSIDFNETLHLDNGEYLVYDYFNKEFLGICSGKIVLDLKPYESKILSIRRKVSHPQIISTSRHITQGVAEIKDMNWEEKSKTLSIKADLISKENYVVTLYVPNGYKIKDCNCGTYKLRDNIATFTIKPSNNKTIKIKFL